MLLTFICAQHTQPHCAYLIQDQKRNPCMRLCFYQADYMCENFIPKNYCLYNKLSCMETFDNACAGVRLQLSMCWVEATQKPAMKKYTAVIMSPCLNHCKGYSTARLL